MSSKPSPAPDAEILITGVAMGESPRWHENRLWFSDWGAQEILAVDSKGNSEVAVRVPFSLPFCIDWLLDGRLLVVSGREGLLLRRERNGSLVTHADLREGCRTGACGPTSETASPPSRTRTQRLLGGDFQAVVCDAPLWSSQRAFSFRIQFQ